MTPGRPCTIQWPAVIDWSKPSSILAQEIGCSRWMVHHHRRNGGHPKPITRKPGSGLWQTRKKEEDNEI